MLQRSEIGRLILENLVSDEPSVKTAEVKFVPEDAVKISTGLIKIASLPYKEDVYKSVQEIMKIAAECLRGLCTSLESVQAEKEHLEKVAHVRSLIDSMVDYGMVDEADVDEKIASLVKKTPHELEIIKEAMNLSGRNGGKGVFFEIEKTSDDHQAKSSEKRDMFDSVIDE
jgi:hypothetical protein